MLENRLLLMASGLCGCCAVISCYLPEYKYFKTCTRCMWILITVIGVAAVVLMPTERMNMHYIFATKEGAFLAISVAMSIFGFFLLRFKDRRASQVFCTYAIISCFMYLTCYVLTP